MSSSAGTEELKFYSYRQFCENYTKWCEENKETLHFNAVIGQKMEVDFAGKTFQMVDHLTGELLEIVVFVAVLPYSQLIYAEGMVSTKEPQWIAATTTPSATLVVSLRWWSATTASKLSLPTRTGLRRS